jgi:hypothetical protein
MKTSLLIAAALGALLAGCGEKSDQPAPSTNAATGDGNPLNAPANYLGGLAKGQQSAVKTVDVSSLNQAIQLFNVQEGRFPKDLNELVEKKYIPKIPEAPHGMKIVYDANAGSVKVVKP